MEKTVKDIAEFIGGEVIGDEAVIITGVAGLEEAQSGDLSFLANKKYKPLLQKTKASAVLVASKDADKAQTTLIQVDNPSLAFSRLLSLVTENMPETFQGVHETAVIADTAKIGKDVNIGPHVTIEDEVEIADKTKIGAGSFIGFKTKIGNDCIVFPNVSIYHQTIIRDRVIIHSGSVVGSDGFGYVLQQGVHEKIPQIGIVEIEDDVEIGANTTIDRARFDRTLIGAGTKIDNHVQIAHNVKVGKGCIIVAHAGISGSTTIEDYVVIGGQVGVAGHLTVGTGSMVAAQSGITKSVEPHSVMFGSPALPHMRTKRVNAAVAKLPKYLKMIRDLQQKIQALEEKL